MNRLKDIRKEKKLTLNQLSEKIGIPRATLSRYENGTSEPKQETWQKMADFFEVSVGYLMGISFQRISKESALEIFKNIYFDYLSNGNNLEEKEIKHLKYFDNDNLDKVLEKAIRAYFSLPVLSLENEWTTLEDISVLKVWLFDYLSELYKKEVLTNQNLIDDTIKNIPANQVVKEYGSFKFIKLSKEDLDLLKSESKETKEEVKSLLTSGLSITAHKYEAGIAIELKKDIIKILNSTRKELSNLKNKYPDNPSKIEEAIYLHSNDEDIDLGWFKIGKQENNDLNLSESTKEFFIRVASEKLNKNI